VFASAWRRCVSSSRASVKPRAPASSAKASEALRSPSRTTAAKAANSAGDAACAGVSAAMLAKPRSRSRAQEPVVSPLETAAALRLAATP
jgi:hypothetical protein